MLVYLKITCIKMYFVGWQSLADYYGGGGGGGGGGGHTGCTVLRLPVYRQWQSQWSRH